MTVYVTVPILFYWTNVTKTCKSPAQSQMLRQDERWEQPYKKNTQKEIFFFFYLCVLLNILFRMRSLAAPSQGSQTSVNNLPCAKKKKKENPHTHTQHSQKKGGFELHRMAEHLGPSSSVWNPRAEEQIKCGTAGEEQEGKFQTNICTCGGSRVGGGLPNVFMSWTPKMNTPDFCSPVPTFFLNLHKPMWELSILLLLLPIIIIIDVTF